MAAEFRTCRNKGFHITFKNGWTLSVQFGGGNYCDNYRNDILRIPTGDTTCANAEIAIFSDARDEWFDFDGNTVLGRVTPDDLAEWVAKVSAWPRGGIV